jgi:hypothetical protein
MFLSCSWHYGFRESSRICPLPSDVFSPFHINFYPSLSIHVLHSWLNHHLSVDTITEMYKKPTGPKADTGKCVRNKVGVVAWLTLLQEWCKVNAIWKTSHRTHQSDLPRSYNSGICMEEIYCVISASIARLLHSLLRIDQTGHSKDLVADDFVCQSRLILTALCLGNK